MRSVFGPVIRNDTPVSLSPYREAVGLFGIPMGRDTAAQLEATSHVGVLWQIIDRISTAVGAVEWRLYRKAASGREEDRTEVANHAALSVWQRPTPFHTRAALMEEVQQPVDLVGEGTMLIARAGGPASPPVELWPVAPNRLEPVPHPTLFIEHWWYRDNVGGKSRVENRDMLRIRKPNPKDPYRGLGPVQALLADIDSARYSAEWNRNFFINGAEHGGIIQYDESLDDNDYRTATERWRDNHRGVANAHRVAILDNGAKWVDRKATVKDLQIAELRAIPGELIRQAFGFPKAMLGDAGDVNRATALAGKAIFAENLVVPRLERWKALLNRWFLPQFAGGEGLEFDYENPVPADAEALDRERDSKVSAAVALKTAGYDPVSVLAAVGLPEIPVAEIGDGDGLSVEAIGNMLQSLYLATPEKAVVTWEEARDIANRAGLDLPVIPFPGAPATPGLQVAARHGRSFQNVAPRLRAQVSDDLAAVQEQWETALGKLLDKWGPVTEAQRDALVEQIRDAVEDGQVAQLGELRVDEDASNDGVDLLVAAMVNLGIAAGKQQADEASKQGVSVEPARLDDSDVEQTAHATSWLLATSLAAAAGREALRLATPGVSGRDVAEQVAGFIDDLSDRQLRDQLGGALTAAQNQARIATLEGAPDADYFATEELDSNTCPECRAVDGKRFETLEDARTEYANGGYRRCQGRERCRGTIVAIWET